MKGPKITPRQILFIALFSVLHWAAPFIHNSIERMGFPDDPLYLVPVVILWLVAEPMNFMTGWAWDVFKDGNWFVGGVFGFVLERLLAAALYLRSKLDSKGAKGSDPA